MGKPKIPLDSIRYSEPHYPTMYDKPSECVYCSKPSARKRSKYGCNKCGGVHLCVNTPCMILAVLYIPLQAHDKI